jgi:hypothetical protein
MSFSPKHSKPFSSDTLRKKEELRETVDGYRQKLDAQWQELQTNTTLYGKQALVIGGIIAGVYLLLETILPKADDEEEFEEKEIVAKTPPKIQKIKSESDFKIGKALQGLAWTLVSGWARQQFSNYIAAQTKSDAPKES